MLKEVKALHEAGTALPSHVAPFRIYADFVPESMADEVTSLVEEVENDGDGAGASSTPQGKRKGAPSSASNSKKKGKASSGMELAAALFDS